MARRLPLLKTGDLIFIHNLTWSTLLTMVRFRTWWTHVAMYYGADKTVEMTNKNFRYLTFSKRYPANKIMIVRFRSLTVADRARLRKEARKYTSAKFDRLRLILPLLPQLRQNRFWCTTFIDRIYSGALGKRLDVKAMTQRGRKYIERLDADIIYDYRKP